MFYLIWLKKFSPSIYYYSFNANRFLEKMLEIGKVKSTKDNNSSVTSLFYSIDANFVLSFLCY